MIRPLGDRVLIELPPKDEEKKTASGIILTESPTGDKIQQGVVRGIGPSFKDTTLKVGDTVQFSKYGFEDVTDTDGKEYIITNEANVIAIVHDDIQN